jgi:hypothetical protein
VAWVDRRSGSGELYGRVLNADGSVKSAEVVLNATVTAPLLPRLALVGSAPVGVWMEDTTGDGGSDAVRWGAFDMAPKASNGVWLSTNPTPTGQSSGFPAVAGDALRQVTAWGNFELVGAMTARLRASEMKPDGTVQCTAAEIDSATGTASIFPGAAVVHPGGAAVIYARRDATSSSIQLTRSKADGTCQFTAGMPIATGIPTLGGRPDMAYGSTGFAVVWGHKEVKTKIRRRMFGPNYCD